MMTRLQSVTGFVAVGSLIILGATIIAASAVGASPPQTDAAIAPQTSTADDAMRDYDDTIRRGDAFYDAGNYFEAVLSYERARRVAYNNKLKIDTAALDQKLARARAARDGKPPAGRGIPGSDSARGADPKAAENPGRAEWLVELTTLIDTKPRPMAR